MEVLKRFKSEQNQVLLMIFTIGGLFGFLYETLFYRIDLGYFVKRGTTFGPWIPIYAFGALFIVLATDRIKDRPLALLIVGSLISGVLEFITGFVLYHMFAIRLWDYNVEIWNWGNIGGYICFRSVAFFGLSAVTLQYIVHPLILKISKKIDDKRFARFAIVPAVIFILDIAISTILNLCKL